MASGARLSERTHAAPVDHPDQVVATYQEVVPAEPALEGAEGMFDQTGTLTHLLWPLIGHPLPLGLNQRRVLTAVNAVHAAGVGPAHRFQRAGSALTGRAAVAGVPSAVLLMRLTARGEQFTGGADVDIKGTVVRESLAAEAAVAGNRLVLIRDGGLDRGPSRFAGGQFGLTGVAGIGDRGKGSTPSTAMVSRH